MPGERMQWVFELLDRTSKPATSITTALISAERALNSVSQGTGPAKAGLNSFLSSFVKLGNHAPLVIDPLNAAMKVVSGLGSAAVSAAETMASLSFQAGSFAVETLAFKESTLASFKLMLGTEEAAQRIFAQAEDFAKKTPFESMDVVRGFKTLLSAGFTEHQVPVMFQALGDISAASGFDPQVIPMITRQFAQIQSMNRVSMEDLRSITNWSSQAGIGVSAIFDAVAKKMHVTTQAVGALLHGGKLDASTFFGGFLEAVQTRSGGAVGNVMLEQSKTLIGLWSTLKSVPQDTFLNMDLSGLKGFTALKGALENAIKLFDDGNVVGERFRNTVKNTFERVFTGVFGSFAGLDGMETMEKVAGGILTTFEGIVAVARSGFGFIGGLFSGLAEGLGGLGDLMNGGGLDPARVELMVGQFREFGRQLGHDLGIIVTLAERLVDLLDITEGASARVAAPFQNMLAMSSELPVVGPMLRMFQDVGGQAAISYAQGLQDNAIEARYAGATLGGEGEGGLKDRIEAHSPSRVFQEIGGFAADGFRLGLEGGMGPLLDGFGSTGSRGVSGTSSGGAGVTLIFQEGAFQFSGGDAASQAKQVKETLLSELRGAFREFGLEMGTA